MSIKTVDMTPTWSGIVGHMLLVLENPDASSESRRIIHEEIGRMAEAADKYNDLQRMNQNAIDLIEGK